MEPEDEEGPCAPEGAPPIKKRRKKQKRVVDNFLLLPVEATHGLSSEIKEELQYAYNILQMIMGISKIEPFLDKPNENLFGMSSYYNIIRKPMWLLEVQRKLLSREYEDISGFVADIRQILENCYRFWGPTHKFTRKALFIEHKLEQKLCILPEEVREKCLDPELKASEVIVKTEPDVEEFPSDQPPQETLRECSVALTLTKGFESKILNRVLESDEPQDNEDIEEQNQKEAEMLNWEREHLVSDIHKEEINAMWQLAEIGSFLKLTCEALYVEEISQYEVERMLLMPKESTTLATLMTSMLSPQVLRSQLDDKPVMPYEIWTSRLKKRIDYWLSVFYTSSNEFEAFSLCGVEPAFWSCVNLMNPLENNSFHEIPFRQRVWIFKSLCNHLMHSDKPIQDILLDESNTKELRPIRIGGDKLGNIYFRIPFFREIRVYKQARLPDSAFQAINDDDFLTNILEATNELYFNPEENELEFLPTKNDCLMVADNLESLTEFIQKLKTKKQFVLAKNFSKQLKLVRNERRSVEGLIALYTQWHEYQNRSSEYFAHILHLWVSKEKRPPAVFDKVDPKNISSQENEEVLGKRRSKRSQLIDFTTLHSSGDSLEQSSDFESSDVSDWESSYRHKKKKKSEKRKIRKQPSSDSGESSDGLIKEDCNSILSIQEVITLKDEFVEETKPNINELCASSEHGTSLINNTDPALIKCEPLVIKREPLLNECEPLLNECEPSLTKSDPTPSPKRSSLTSSNSLPPSTILNSLPPVPPGCVTEPVIKKEKDDVIYISSDEEKEESNKTILNTKSKQNMIRNGIPPSKAITAVQVPVRTPSPKSPVLARTRTLSQTVPISLPAQPVSVMQPVPMQQMPQPISVSRTPSSSPLSKPQPMQMPLPIIETMPQPIVERQMPQPTASPKAAAPRGSVWTSPKSNMMASPRTRGVSPRLRSPLSSPSIRTPSPRPLQSPLRNALSPSRPVRNPAVRNLFPQSPTVPTVEGVLEIGQKSDGSYGYHVRLPDGGIINMSRTDIDAIRRKNNGVLPVKIEVPLTKNKKF